MCLVPFHNKLVIISLSNINVKWYDATELCYILNKNVIIYIYSPRIEGVLNTTNVVNITPVVPIAINSPMVQCFVMDFLLNSPSLTWLYFIFQRTALTQALGHSSSQSIHLPRERQQSPSVQKTSVLGTPILKAPDQISRWCCPKSGTSQWKSIPWRQC